MIEKLVYKLIFFSFEIKEVVLLFLLKFSDLGKFCEKLGAIVICNQIIINKSKNFILVQ